MHIKKLAYLGLAATDLAAWRDFASNYLGLEVRTLSDGNLGLRIDQEPFAFAIVPSDRNGLDFLGLEVDGEAGLREVAQELRAAGLPVNEGTAADLAARHVSALLWTTDPDGHRVEFYAGRTPLNEPFTPGRPIGGFRTGELGFGHVVLLTPKLAAMEDFYLRLLGFCISDYIDDQVKVRFTHINARHHSLALVGAEQPMLHHIMLEYEQLDDVGRLHDMALTREGMIQTTLGRHSNDHMMSFYSRTPGGFLIETGWGGRLIDTQTWQPEALWSMSFWGHDRLWQPPAARQLAREQNAEAARRGVVVPVQVEARSAFDIVTPR